jgi:hypothetical protein
MMSIIFKLLVTILAFHVPSQQASTMSQFDPLEQKVGSFELNDETVGDALARLNQSFDISISIEGVLPEEGTVTNPELRAKIENRTLAEVLDRLCTLDPRYVWTRDGDSVNFIPRTRLNDPTYFFNRILPELQLEQVRRVDDAAIAVVHQLGDPDENLIFMGIGGTQSFAEPWTASFSSITVRRALNRIARQLGPTYGWQIGGTTKARLIAFHYKLGGQHVKVGDRYPYKY